VLWPSCIAFYDPKRKIIVDKGSSRACGKNYNRFSIHAEQRAIEYCRSCDKRDKYEIYIWRYSRDGNIKPAKCCNACMKLAEKYNYKNRIFTFNNENIETAISDNPGISLGYKIKYNL